MVDCLPHETRIAMLDGLQRFQIIAGAYSDRGGGVCPMLAAHRCGGRTDFRSFARAWDTFTGARRGRRATERELRTLTAQLEASLWNDEPVLDLRREAERAKEAKEQSKKQAKAQSKKQAKAGPDQGGSGEHSAKRSRRPVRAWLRPFRAWDDYRAAVATAHRQVAQPEPGEPERYGPLEEAASSGRTIITSGMTQAGESRSKQRTTSATSSG
jgi:hypothetical protein